MDRDIELHDSTVASLALDGGDAVIALRPAYVHHDGSGWFQDFDFRIEAGIINRLPVALPIAISDGTLRIGDQSLEGLVPVTSESRDLVSLELLLVSGESVVIRGSGLQIVEQSQAAFVERLPWSHGG